MRASSAAPRSLSMTASTPRERAVGARGRRGSRRRRWRSPRTRPRPAPARPGASRISSGSGEATTRRQPFSPRSSQVSPCSTSSAASSAGRNRPIGLVGLVKPGSSASTRVRVTTAARTPVDAAAGQRGVERVHQHEAEGRLGLRAAPVQRDRGYDGRGQLVLDQQVADLGAVAVGDHDVDARGEQVGDRLHRDLGGGDLVLRRGRGRRRSSWRCRPARAGPSWRRT